jgi:hypothetical protein
MVICRAMHEAEIARRTLPALLFVAWCAAGCASELPAPDAPRSDAFARDVAAPADQGAAGEALPVPDLGRSDGQAADARLADRGPPADGAAGACASWSAWTCEVDPVLLCRATCAAGPLQLSCINSGACVCGVSTGPCGTFSAVEPCDVCREAVEANCCGK